jgi:hypothetical protein
MKSLQNPVKAQRQVHESKKLYKVSVMMNKLQVGCLKLGILPSDPFPWPTLARTQFFYSPVSLFPNLLPKLFPFLIKRY